MRLVTVEGLHLAVTSSTEAPVGARTAGAGRGVTLRSTALGTVGTRVAFVVPAPVRFFAVRSNADVAPDEGTSPVVDVVSEAGLALA